VFALAAAVESEGHAAPPLFLSAKAENRGKSAAVRETLLEVWINGLASGDTALLIEKNGEFFARRSDLERWRLKGGGNRDFPYRGEIYVPLKSIDGLTYAIDPKTMRVRIEAPPNAFVPSRFGGRRASAAAAEPGLGAFFNYDLMVQGDSAYSELSGLGEVGFFGGGGLLLGNFVYRSEEATAPVRLDTSFRYDWPETFRSLTLGDGISRGASFWGNAMHFGGIQWGTDFRLQPAFVTMPLLTFRGEAVLPSTVDLYINNTLQMHQEVPPGPFAIDHAPVLSGPGEAQIVVTDLLGRAQVISGTFYAAPQLLGSGLEDYTVQGGFVRENYGVAGNDYGDYFASGLYRRGITDTFTAEISGEYAEALQTVGGSGQWLLEGGGVLSTAAALSNRGGVVGGTGVIGYDRAMHGMNVGGTLRASTDAFDRLGASRPPARTEEHVYAGYAVRKLGFFHGDFTHRDYRDSDDVAIAGIGYHRSWREIGTLGISAYRTLIPQAETAFSVYFTTAFGERQSGSVAYSEDAGGGRETVRFGQHLPPGPGYGYAISADFGAYERLEALLEWQTDYGTYRAGASHMEQGDSYRASANGGMALMNGEGFLSRRIDQSFAVVDTGELSDIRVFKDNQPVGRTGGSGKLLVPNLRAYEKNPIRIEERDLPLDAALPSLSQEAVPAYRSGVAVSFALQHVRRALLHVVREDGTPVPPGAGVRIKGEAAHFPVGRDGRVYLEGLRERNRIQVAWSGGACEFTLDYPPSDDPMPTLGTFTCKGAVP